MQHTICVKTKDMKRTYNVINTHRTGNVEEYTHTFNRTQKKEQLGKDEVEEKKKSSGRVPPSVFTGLLVGWFLSLVPSVLLLTMDGNTHGSSARHGSLAQSLYSKHQTNPWRPYPPGCLPDGGHPSPEGALKEPCRYA